MLPLDCFLLRHKESEGNLALRKYKEWLKLNRFLRWFRGFPFTSEFINRHQSHFRLTDKGKDQGLVVSKWLKDWLEEKNLPHFDRHVVSPHFRTLESGGGLDLPNATWEIDNRLHERKNGLHGIIYDKEWEKRYLESMDPEQNHRFYTPMPDGESISDVCDRLYSFVRDLDRDGLNQDRVIVVAHADVMQALRIIFEGILPDRYDELNKMNLRHFRIGNGQILHYTRVDPVDSKSINYKRFGWVRSVNPWNPKYAGHGWRAIEQHRYSNEQLLEMVERIPQLIKN